MTARGDSLMCPSCRTSRESEVIDSRPVPSGLTIRRRRGCLSCAHRWTTYEVSAEAYRGVLPLLDVAERLDLLRGILNEIGPRLEAAKQRRQE
jgi:transcriptional regulator NrdR family protein